MLPVIAYAVDDTPLDQLVDMVMALGREKRVPLQLMLASDDPRECVQAIQGLSGIALLLLGVRTVRTEEGRDALRIARRAILQNRDHYLVYILDHPQELEIAASLCLRPSGILTLPLKEQLSRLTLQRLVSDYAAFTQEEDDEAPYIMVQSGRMHVRVDIDSIQYIEALDKKLIIYQDGQMISVYTSIAELEKRLSEGFFRCHRSILVREKAIRSIDMARMEIQLSGGARVPLARARKAEARELLIRMGGEAS